MALLKIANMGNPVLSAAAAPVPLPLDDDVRRLVRDMVETMRDAPGVGLAAPQVHASLRLIVVQPARERDAPQVLINPVLEPVGDEVELGVEGCLSIPHWRGIVPRYQTVRYQATDPDGRGVQGEASGFHARVLQHEVDHLDGILYLARLRDSRDLATEGEARHLLARLDAYANVHGEDSAV